MYIYIYLYIYIYIYIYICYIYDLIYIIYVCIFMLYIYTIYLSVCFYIYVIHIHINVYKNNIEEKRFFKKCSYIPIFENLRFLKIQKLFLFSKGFFLIISDYKEIESIYITKESNGKKHIKL